MSGERGGPMLKAAGLWAKTSVKGGQYLTGRLGGVKVLVLENRDRKGDDDPSHHLFFVEAQPRPERGDGQQRASSMPPDRQRPSTPHPKALSDQVDPAHSEDHRRVAWVNRAGRPENPT
jgi:hypothetical protein